LSGFFNIKKTNTKNFFWRSVQIGSRQGTTFFILVISAKLLGSREFGIYNYAVAITFFFTLLADFGISRAVAKYVVEYKTKNPEKVELLYFNSAVIMLTLAIAFGALFLIFAKTIVGENYRYIYYLLPVFIFLPLASLFDGFYSGLMQFKKLSIISLASGIISIIATYFLISRFKIDGAFFSLDLYYILTFVFFASSFKLFKPKFDRDIIKEVGKYSTIIGISALGHFLYSKGVTYILGQYNFFSQVGYYEIIDKVFIMLSFPFIIYGQIIAPNITEDITLERNNIVINKYKKVVYISIPAAILISIALWQALPFFIKIFLPKYYTPDFLKIFDISLFHLPFILLSGIIAQPFIIATGKAKYSLLTIPLGILNIALGVVFIEMFGFMGVVYSTIVISISNKLLTFSLVYNSLKPRQ
jgi:O-antigen/teichoic acid export membrane protein